MRGRLVVGNWKMNGDTASNARLLDAIARGWQAAADRGLAVCVPFPYLAQARERLAGSAVAWGAQDVSEYPSGAHTGEVSAAMVAEFGSRYAIVGHSERRQAHGESDALVAAKAAAALAADLVPVVCVGETLAEREAGRASDVLAMQVRTALSRLDERHKRAPILLAYEPVWAIGANGIPATSDYADARQAEIIDVAQDALGRRIPCLYGGSVNPGNCAELIACPHVDGLFIGRAAWTVEGYLDILARCAATL